MLRAQEDSLSCVPHDDGWQALQLCGGLQNLGGPLSRAVREGFESVGDSGLDFVFE